MPNSTPTWRARPVVRLSGVDVTSQTYAGSGQREQVRRYVLSYGWDWNEYDLQQVQMDGWCSSGDPTEDPNTFLLPPESANPTCGAGTGNTWPPATTFTYSALGAVAVPPPTPTFYKMPNVDVGGVPAGVINLPTLVDLNADGMPDIINPASASSQEVELNSVGSSLNTWNALPLSLLHPLLGVNPGNMGPWSPNYATGSFLNDSQVNTAWFDPAWFDWTTASKNTTAGVGYVTYAPFFTSSTALDWGTPVQQTLPSVFPGALQNCYAPPTTQPNFWWCEEGTRYAGGDQKFANLDIDGDGFEDLLVSSTYGSGPVSYASATQTQNYFTALNVKFTQRAITGLVSPFAAPLPQQTANYSGDTPPNSPPYTDQPNLCMGGFTDVSQYLNTANNNTVGWSFGDLNGDGLPDFVNYGSNGELGVFFGHGDGVFGICPLSASSYSVACGCEAPLTGAATSGITGLAFSLPVNPINLQRPNLNVQFHDVDGDGLDDAIMPTSDGFDVYINIAGIGLTQTPIHVAAAAPLG